MFGGVCRQWWTLQLHLSDRCRRGQKVFGARHNQIIAVQRRWRQTSQRLRHEV